MVDAFVVLPADRALQSTTFARDGVGELTGARSRVEFLEWLRTSVPAEMN